MDTKVNVNENSLKGFMGESTYPKEHHVITIEPDNSAGDDVTLFPELFATGNPVFRRHILPWKQRFNWDCGVACVAMCLSMQDRRNLYKNLDFYKKYFQFNNSTWTIDLCYILNYYGMKFHFATRFAGVDPQLRHYAFYRRSIDKDTSRVLNAFAQAPSNGIDVIVSKTDIQTIFQHIYTRGPAIVLVNANLIRCLDCWRVYSNLFSCCLKNCYQGHYILVIGFDLKNNCIIYNNPTFGDRTCRIYIGDFESARTAHGTDWDTVFVVTL